MQKASSGAFDRVLAIDDENDVVINYWCGESPYAEGRKQLKWNLHDSLGPQVMVADQRLTGRHPAPHSMFFLFYVLYFLCGCTVSLNPEITCIRRCGRAGGVTSTEQTTILPTSTSGLFFAQTYKGRAFVRPFLFVPPERHSLCVLS